MNDLTQDKPLLQSMVSAEIWALYHAEPSQFKERVTAYFALGYPGWRVVNAKYSNRTIYLRDDRKLVERFTIGRT